MKINTICQKLGITKVFYNHEIYAIADDSKKCVDNSIFFAIEGNRIDGHCKIEEAINNGAKTIVLQKKVKEHNNINYIYCSNSKKMLGEFLHIYYHHFTKNLSIIGVVGTNGKTTTSTIIYEYLNYINKKCMLIGSNGLKTKSFSLKHNNTTPKCIDLYDYFYMAYKKNIKYIVMEVSSISVSELRVFKIDFKTLIFTNFSEDHLDYHKNMDRYFFAKVIPFYKLNDKSYAILNADCKMSKLIDKHTTAIIKSYSIFNNSNYKASNVYMNEAGLEFDINNKHYHSNLLGKFNVYNILPLFIICDIYNFNNKYIFNFLNEFKSVDGRMNLIHFNDKSIIIDYAHTEEAVLNAIEEAKKLVKGKIYVVVGCGGDREKEKRQKIGKVLNDEDVDIILTTDNPRFENPRDIINDILLGINKQATVIENRKEAIDYALNKTNKEDLVLILGKGCEDYIDINGKKIHYSDYDVINEYRNNLL